MVNKLNNGVKFLYDVNERYNYISLDFCYRVGFSNECCSELGFTHLIEHLFLRSTQSNKFMELITKLECLGTQINACTKREFTHFYMETTKENLKESFNIFMQLIKNEYYDPNEFLNTLKVVNEEIILYRNDLLDNLKNKLNKNLYTDAFSNSITDKSLEEDIDIQRVKEYKIKNFSSENLIVYLIGNPYPEDISFIKNELSFLSKTSTNQNKSGFKHKSNTNIVLQSNNIAMIGYELLLETKNFRDMIAAKVCSKFFGGCITSRLSSRLKINNALVYIAYSYVDYYSDFVTLTIVVQCSILNVEKIQNELKNIFLDIKQNHANKYELQKSKNLLIFNYLKEFANLIKYSEFKSEIFAIYNQEISVDTLKDLILNIDERDIVKIIKKIWI